MLNVSLQNLCISFCSSSYGSTITFLVAEFHCTKTVATLGLSLYALALGFGPLAWAPLSEVLGRKPVFVATFVPLLVSHLGCIYAPNVATLLVCRVLGGVTGCSVATNAGGTLADIYTHKQRTLAVAGLILFEIHGPVLGPIVGGLVIQYTGHQWRDVFWTMFGFTGVMALLGTFTVPETYAPAILRRIARRASRKTGKVYVSAYDVEREKRLLPLLRLNLLRPVKLLILEPIVLLFSLYIAIVYGILYLFFTAFPIVFVQNRHWSLVASGLSFMGIGVGSYVAIAMTPLVAYFYNRAKAAAGGSNAAPEARLLFGCVGGAMLPISLFWFAWTCQPSIQFIVPMVATSFFGCGLVFVFISSINYLIDIYGPFAASALAANAILRSFFGFAFPLFGALMFVNLGDNWATTLLAFITLACAPIPFLFMRYGKVIRSHSRYAPSARETGLVLSVLSQDEKIVSG